MIADLTILYEHPLWFQPLFAALDRAGVAYAAVPITDHVFDPADAALPSPVVFNRVAMSSFLREPEHPIFYAQALFDHWEGRGARVLNGTKVLVIDASKARQLALVSRLGLLAPATRAAHRVADLPAAAADLRFPVVAKADIGGAGAGIVKYDTPDDLAAAVADRSVPVGINGVTLVQEYAPRRGGRITRVETLGGRSLYAIDIESAGDTFDLCPADACAIDRPPVKMTRAEPPAELIEAAERIARAVYLDVGGVEYLIDDRDGTARFYDTAVIFSRRTRTRHRASTSRRRAHPEQPGRELTPADPTTRTKDAGLQVSPIRPALLNARRRLQHLRCPTTPDIPSHNANHAHRGERRLGGRSIGTPRFKSRLGSARLS